MYFFECSLEIKFNDSLICIAKYIVIVKTNKAIHFYDRFECVEIKTVKISPNPWFDLGGVAASSGDNPRSLCWHHPFVRGEY